MDSKRAVVRQETWEGTRRSSHRKLENSGEAPTPYLPLGTPIWQVKSDYITPRPSSSLPFFLPPRHHLSFFHNTCFDAGQCSYLHNPSGCTQFSSLWTAVARRKVSPTRPPSSASSATAAPHLRPLRPKRPHTPHKSQNLERDFTAKLSQPLQSGIFQRS